MVQLAWRCLWGESMRIRRPLSLAAIGLATVLATANSVFAVLPREDERADARTWVGQYLKDGGGVPFFVPL